MFANITIEHISTRKHAHAHLSAGVKKLQSANKLVNELSVQVQSQSEQAQKSERECSDLLQKIQQKVDIITKQKKEANELSQNLTKQQADLAVQNKQIEQETSDVQPIFDEAA